MKIFFFLFSIIWTYELVGQTASFYADAMINALEPAHRVYAAEKFDSLFAERISQDNSFTDGLEDLPYVSNQSAEDGAFRILSWQVDAGEGKFNYVGYVQLSDGALHRFDSATGRAGHKVDDMTNITDWSGGLVYKILSAEDGNYMLTFRMLDAFTKVKTLEPLMISDEEVHIGKPGTFDADRRGSSARIALVHSADSNAQITYEPASQRFIFDHLIAVQGRLEGQGPTYVPDGSYKAFEYQDGNWVYIDKLYNQTNDGPLNPSNRETLNQNLFEGGNKKKN